MTLSRAAAGESSACDRYAESSEALAHVPCRGHHLNVSTIGDKFMYRTNRRQRGSARGG